VRYLGALLSGALILVGGAAGAAYPAQTATAAPRLVHTATAAAQCTVTLPGGGKALWRRDANGQQGVINETGSDTGLIAHVGGDVYVFSRTQLRSPGATGAAAAPYDVTAAAASTCGIDTNAGASSATGSGTSAKASHGFALGKLTVNVLDATGAPADAYVFLRNVDDIALADTYVAAVGGVVKAQVPVGHYAVEAYTVYVGATGLVGQVNIDPDFAVTRAGATVTLDGRKATSKVVVPATPQPAALVGGTLGIGRSAAAEPTTDANWLVYDLVSNYASGSLSITPSARVTHGALDVVGTFETASPTTVPSPYTYHVEEPYSGYVPASWPASADARSFAAVTRNYYARGSSRVELVLDGAVPRSYNQGNPDYDVTDLFDDPIRYLSAPYTDTEYFTGGTGLIWQAMATDDLYFNELTVTAPHTYTAGTHSVESLGEGAQHPAAVIDTERLATLCPACSSTNALEFNLYPVTDNGYGDIGYGNQSPVAAGNYENYSYQLLRNGVVEASSNTLFPTGLAVTGLPPGRATYQLATTVTRSYADDPLSTSQQSVWTFAADPRGGDGIPRNWTCVDGTSDCTALPLLYADYTVSGTSLSNALTPGAHELSLDVYAQQYSHAPGIAGASVQVSYDGGSTWTSAPVSGRAGHYTAGFAIPAAATGSVSLRVSGWDTAGDRVEQTVLNAYTVG